MGHLVGSYITVVFSIEGNEYVTSGIFSPNHGVAGDVKAPQKIYSSTTNQGKEHSSS